MADQQAIDILRHLQNEAVDIGEGPFVAGDLAHDVDAQLAAETSRAALYAILASWAVILLYLWFRFGNWTFGTAAVLCLIHDLCFTLGIIAGCHYLVHGLPWLATALGIGLWLSALNALYRDVKYVTPFLVQFWMFASPVAYPTSLVPEKWRWLYGLNPMAGVIEGFRWALTGHGQPPGELIKFSIKAQFQPKGGAEACNRRQLV